MQSFSFVPNMATGKIGAMALQGEIREILALLRAKEDERRKLDVEIAALRSELEAAWALLANTPAGKKRIRRTRRRPSHPAYKPESSVGRAIDVLREAKEPLHIDTIVERIQAAGYPVAKTTLAGN